jgi:hypothetical protein
LSENKIARYDSLKVANPQKLAIFLVGDPWPGALSGLILGEDIDLPLPRLKTNSCDLYF